MGHAKAILSAKEPSVQRNLAKKCVEEGLSVRALEQIVARSIVLEKPRKKVKTADDSAYPEIADRMRKYLGTKVAIKHDKKSGRGKVVVNYFSEEELDRLVELLAQ
jgi:ParB family chromosome partitioning protein